MARHVCKLFGCFGELISTYGQTDIYIIQNINLFRLAIRVTVRVLFEHNFLSGLFLCFEEKIIVLYLIYIVLFYNYVFIIFFISYTNKLTDNSI